MRPPTSTRTPEARSIVRALHIQWRYITLGTSEKEGSHESLIEGSKADERDNFVPTIHPIVFLSHLLARKVS